MRLKRTSNNVCGHVGIHVQVNPVIVVGTINVDQSNTTSNTSLDKVALVGNFRHALEIRISPLPLIFYI